MRFVRFERVTDVKQGADVRMIDLRDESRLAFEACEAIRIVGEGSR